MYEVCWLLIWIWRLPLSLSVPTAVWSLYFALAAVVRFYVVEFNSSTNCRWFSGPFSGKKTLRAYLRLIRIENIDEGTMIENLGSSIRWCPPKNNSALPPCPCNILNWPLFAFKKFPIFRKVNVAPKDASPGHGGKPQYVTSKPKIRHNKKWKFGNT